MIRRPPRSTRTDTPFPYTTLFRSWGYRMGDAAIIDSMLRDGLNDAFSGRHSGWHTEDLVTRSQISRDAQDRWAERSQSRFAQAQADGRFDAAIAPVTVQGRKGETSFARDEAPRPEPPLAGQQGTAQYRARG